MSNIHRLVSTNQRLKRIETALQAAYSMQLLNDLYLRKLEELLVSKGVLTKEDLQAVEKETKPKQSSIIIPQASNE